MKNTILILIAICLIGAAISCKAQGETKHIVVFNQQALVSIEDINTQGKVYRGT
jgi:hypothetical protein